MAEVRIQAIKAVHDTRTRASANADDLVTMARELGAPPAVLTQLSALDGATASWIAKMLRDASSSETPDDENAGPGDVAAACLRAVKTFPHLRANGKAGLTEREIQLCAAKKIKPEDYAKTRAAIKRASR